MKRLLPWLPAAALLIQLDRAAAPPPPPFLTEDLPAVVRALPPRDEGRFGRAGDTLNIIFVGSPQTVSAALSAAGWTAIPRGCADSFFAGLREVWLGWPLKSFPPMQAYRVMSRVQDMNWAIALSPMSARHHFRLWRTGIRDAKGRELWWGSGNLDLSLRLHDLSHVPDPDMSIERAKILETLKGSPLVESAELLPVPQVPRSGANDNRYRFVHDGRALVVVLKS
jgi:hypothetical protein